MTAYTDFIARVNSVVNESSTAMSTLVPQAVEYAVRSLERQFKFAYLRRIEYRALLPELATPEVLFAYENGLGPNAVALSRFAPFPDGTIGIIFNIQTQGLTLFQVGDYVRFNGELGPIMDPLTGTYGQISAINIVGTQVNDMTINVPDAGLVPVAAEFEPVGFRLERLVSNPFEIVGYDPGLLPFGQDCFEIECLDICDPDDKSSILRKNVEAFSMKAISKENDSTLSTYVGTVPAGYTMLGEAELQDAQIVGSLVLDPKEQVLLFRPKPDRAYWVRATVWRFSAWPQDDHWLLGPAQDVLLYQTLIELGPGLRDKDLMEMGAAMLKMKLQELGISNTYHRHSGDTGRMEYNAYRDQNL